MISTYTPLANLTLTAAQKTITFSSIPATFRDLVLVMEHLVTGAASNKIVRFNGDSGSNYPWIYMGGNGSSAITGSNTSTSLLVEALAAGSTTESLLTIVNIMDYSATDKHKVALIRNGRAGQATDAITCRWTNTAAINSISISQNNAISDFASGSTFALYGIVS